MHTALYLRIVCLRNFFASNFAVRENTSKGPETQAQAGPNQATETHALFFLQTLIELIVTHVINPCS